MRNETTVRFHSVWSEATTTTAAATATTITATAAATTRTATPPGSR